MDELSPLVPIIEAALLASSESLTVARIISLFREDAAPTADEVVLAMEQLATRLEGHGFELKQVASGYRLQVRTQYAGIIQNLWEEKPARYTKALMETLSLIAYRQPITRGEIESIRGVAVSSQMVRTLQEHEWVRVVGHKEIPGRPALYATTKHFLDYFQLKSLDELPPLSAVETIGTLPGPAEATLAEVPNGDEASATEEDSLAFIEAHLDAIAVEDDAFEADAFDEANDDGGDSTSHVETVEA